MAGTSPTQPLDNDITLLSEPGGAQVHLRITGPFEGRTVTWDAIFRIAEGNQPNAIEIGTAGPHGMPLTRLVVVETANMLARPREDYVETAELVTLVSQRSHASGVGIQAWLGKENRITLLSKARGHYEVDTSK